MIIKPVDTPAITPLELWDAQTELGPLWQLMTDKRFAPMLVTVLQQLHRGELATMFSAGRCLPAAPFEAVFLCGGGALDPAVSACLAGVAQPVFTAPNPLFSGVDGGLQYLASIGLNGWAMDVGQTQIKLGFGHHYQTFERDLAQLPLLLPQHTRTHDEDEDKFSRWVAEALAQRPADSPSSIALALPCEVNSGQKQAAQALGACSYFPAQADFSLLESIDQFAAGGIDTVYLFNDAQIAAVYAANDSRLATYRSVLVLTLGYAVGGAMLCR
ncbi:hypothetical protein [Corallincola spongiicola]|uniref:ROK family protein n=1 Tax=Corallincola spongiicola TaxID=2520508 RepID=A0ABY1WT54_9GAMM|nr:hypothetical protein [Corallincola spongiicola]TAA47921.1 hypothetical protein EXY25_01360 [Corallincola spongiicola]